ncbi:hypothetical protein VTK26DRAFT_7100 [Humicola hyalothermophila]
MTATAKSPAESFWPLGLPDPESRLQFPKPSSDSSSLTSPLALPRGVAGYFDHVATKGSAPTQLSSAPYSSRATRVYSPLSPGARDPTPQQVSFLPPHLLAKSKHGDHHLEQYRPSSLPPKVRNGLTSPMVGENGLHPGQGSAAGGLPLAGLNPLGSGPLSPVDLAVSGHPRSVSADGASAPSYVQIIRRLVQQNSRIREAWEAERKYLEANRERAEEVYKEERALMEEERAEWDAEKAALLREIERLRQQVSALEGGSPPARNGNRALSPTSFSGLNLRGGTMGALGDSARSSQSSQGNSLLVSRNERPMGPSGGSSQSPAGRRRPDPPVPGPRAPTTDFLKPDSVPETEHGPTPVVDVQEIHPELEGIPLRAKSVQKPTFTDSPSHTGSQPCSQTGSPPTSSESPKAARKEQTLQVLKADEVARLTMHAGHTPSHSLSSIATVTSSGVATASSDGGDSTPTVPRELNANGRIVAEVTGKDAASSESSGHDQQVDDHPEPVLEPGEDPELKGPLMVRNMPAHDEIFFQKLSDRLEEVVKDDRAALPAVLKDGESGSESPAAQQQADEQQQLQQSKPHVEEEDDHQAGTHELRRTDSSGTEGSSKGEETPEIPLKFKRKMNFGAPFGEML